MAIWGKITKAKSDLTPEEKSELQRQVKRDATRFSVDCDLRLREQSMIRAPDA